MVATGKQEKQDEAVAFADFQQFCTDKQASTKEEIAKGAETMELLTTEIQQLESEISQVAEEIDALQRTVASADADLKANKAQREHKRAALYKDAIMELSSSDSSFDDLALGEPGGTVDELTDLGGVRPRASLSGPLGSLRAREGLGELGALP